MPEVSLDKKISRRYYKIFRKYNLNTFKNFIFDVDLNIMVESANLNFEIEAFKNIHIKQDSNIDEFIKIYQSNTFRTSTSDYMLKKNIQNILKK